jgi:two-component system nitrogen regulation response regulator GlnG
MATLLVVDDEPNILYSLEKGLRSETLEVLGAATAQEGIELLRQRRPDAVVLDLRLPDMSGLEAFDLMHQIDPRLPIIIITAYATTETAIEAMKRGAFEYLLKPLDIHQLRDVVARAVELRRLRHVPAVFAETQPADDSIVDRIVGQSAAMQEVYKAIGRVAPLDVPVLLVGESGTGKELAARAIYQHSRRSQGPFLTLNCAAIPETLLESELFGHERGAFTGANRRRIGKFEQANGGTIFLDEIGDMTGAVQPKLLRLLQEQRFERLGSNQTIQTDVRVIAATNRNLPELVAAGRFRQDLFYRLEVFTIRLPPLRDRLDDLPLLVEHFLKLLNRALGKQVRSVAPETLHLLHTHGWPGNVRELYSALKYAVVQAAGEVLTPDSLPGNVRLRALEGPRAEELRPPAAHSSEEPVPVQGAEDAQAQEPSRREPPVNSVEVALLVGNLLCAGEPDIYRRVSLEVDRVALVAVLRHVKGNQVQASELLGISRTTLRAKLRSLGLAIGKQLLTELGEAD